PNFSGFSLSPVLSRVVCPGPAIEIRHNSFQRETPLGRDSFLQELRSTLSGFSEILTAEFQVTGIDAGSMPGVALSSGQLQTRIRYELVGTGRGFYREQRVGYWQLTWERSVPDEFRVRSWQAEDETLSRSAQPSYVEITAAALGGN